MGLNITCIRALSLMYILTYTYVRRTLLFVLFVIKVECTVLLYHKIQCI